MTIIKQIGMVFLLCLFGSEAFAEYRYTFVPSLSIVETYDDNIYLRSTDKTSDWTTVILPAISFGVSCPTKGVTLSYNTPFVFYRRRTEHNTIRQGADLSAFHQVGPYTRVDFSDSFYRGEEPVEPLQTIYATRRTRNPYFRNSADIKVSHQFGPRDNIFVGYNDNHLENKDPSVEDVRIQTPFAGLAYWFDIKNSLEFNVRYSISDYERSPDFKQNSESVRFMHLLSQESSLSVDYSHAGMDYKPGRTDYEVHNGNISYNTVLWRYFRVKAGIGSYVYNPKEGDSDSRVNYLLDINFEREAGIKFERGSLSFGLQSGYRQEFIDAQNSGFVTFWSANSGISYLLRQNLTASAALSYREDRFTEQADRLDTVWSGSVGLVYDCGRWLVFSLSGKHVQRDSSVDINDYDDNQAMLMISLRDKMR